MTIKTVTLVEIFDSDLDELLALRSRSISSERVESYLSVMIAYLSGDEVALKEQTQLLESRAAQHPEWELIRLLANARLQIRRHSFVHETFERLVSSIPLHPEWAGEIHFILSNKAGAEKDYRSDKDHSFAAWKCLKQLGSKRKSVRALMNYVAAESCLAPEKHYLSDLHFVYREAKKSGDRTSIGTTLMNLSREYQKLGALSVAMKHSQRSVAVLSKNAGNLAYYLALVHRAHLYCELGAYADAKVDLDAALCSKFPEIHSAAKALESLHPSVRLEGRANKASSGARTATWTERLSGGDESASVKLSKLEQRILELLSQKARSKSELIEALYGSRLSLEVTQNRLHNLMNRLRKKFPALISFGDGNYFLSESPFLKLKKAKR